MRPGPRVRIAPSPTGYFHVGTGRTALFNWLYARQHGGTFVLRIEDTDTARNRTEHVEGILRALEWLGLDWDEGPYYQSQRGPLYSAAIDRLIAAGSVYACDCTPEAIQARAKERGGPPGYDGFCRDRGVAIEPGNLLRFRTPDTGESSYDDIIRGTVTVDSKVIEDFGVRKSNGDPLFLLANVVDDADMSITHVIRGEDHISNTHKYLLLWTALGYGAPPVFAHLPLLFNGARQKLSKRRDKVAVEDYRDEGYLPEAMINYLALLGWAPGDDREILSMEELIREFRLEDVKSAGAIFDERKLEHINAEYLRALPVGELVDRAQAWQRGRWEQVAPFVQERARTLAQVFGLTDFLYLPNLRTDPVQWAKSAKDPLFEPMLRAAAKRFADPGLDWKADALHQATLDAGSEAGVEKLRKAQEPIRLVVMGGLVGLPLFQSLEALGRDRTVGRIQGALSRLEAETLTGPRRRSAHLAPGG